LNPPAKVSVSVVLAEVPRVRFRVETFVTRVNEGAATMVSAMVAVFVIEPELPVIVTVAVPGAADEAAVRLRMF
jgi:predicted phosphoribosyltransferase